MNKLQKLKEIIEDEYYLNPGQLDELTRREPVVTARHALAYFLHTEENMPRNAINAILGSLGHGTMRHGVSRYGSLLDTEQTTRERYKQIKQRINKYVKTKHRP